MGKHNFFPSANFSYVQEAKDTITKNQVILSEVRINDSESRNPIET